MLIPEDVSLSLCCRGGPSVAARVAQTWLRVVPLMSSRSRVLSPTWFGIMNEIELLDA